MNDHDQANAGGPYDGIPAARVESGNEGFPAPKDDDLPVLTDIIVTDELTPFPNSSAARREPTLHIPPGPEEIERLAGELVATRMTALRADIDREVAVWLTTELPEVVRGELQDLGDRIVASIRSRVMAALLPELQRAVDETQASQNAG